MKSSIFFLSIFFLLSDCTPVATNEVVEIQGRTMGTTYSVKYVKEGSSDLSSLRDEIEASLKEVNRQMSTYIEDSEISKLNQAKAGISMPIGAWFGETLKLSLDLAQQTQGAFDPTIGPLVNLWGFGPKKHQKQPSDEDIARARTYIGYDKIQLKKTAAGLWSAQKLQNQTYVDLSASAKGFGVDVLSRLLLKHGLKNHLVEIGGELRSLGRKPSGPWRVAIEKPDVSGARTIQEVVSLKDASLATSGSYRNFFESKGEVFPHIIDQKSGKPVKSSLLSVSVIEENCARADALATALFVMGAEKAQAFAEEQKLAAYFILGSSSDKAAAAQVKITPEFKKLGGL